jgi:hypothetical protein
MSASAFRTAVSNLDGTMLLLNLQASCANPQSHYTASKCLEDLSLHTVKRVNLVRNLALSRLRRKSELTRIIRSRISFG